MHLCNFFDLKIICISFIVISLCKCDKYVQSSLKSIKNPFRMGKLNLLWDKATKKLSESKLEVLLSELKIQDKHEITLKRLKSEGGDKDGLHEAELRKKLHVVMKKYDLLGKDEVYEADIPFESVFKDKKLNKLWFKAEKSGFTGDMENEIIQPDSSEKFGHGMSNIMREKHHEIKKGYDQLHKLTSSGPNSKEFSEERVGNLWNLALRSDFSQAELDSLYTELKHYENRLQKVAYLQSHLSALEDKHMEDFEKIDHLNRTTEGQKILVERLLKQQRKVEKQHEDLENRILQRHSDL